MTPKMPAAVGRVKYKSDNYEDGEETTTLSWVWSVIKAEARREAESEPALVSFLYATVLSHVSLSHSLSFHLANKLQSSTLLPTLLYNLFLGTLASHPEGILRSAVADLIAARDRDTACTFFCHCLLNYKGFLALQAHRISHALWQLGRRQIAVALQCRVANVFAVDIHPVARIGRGVLLDHATGVVVGETAVIGNDVSMLHHVTLSRTGNAECNRHPKIGDGVHIGAGATVLGNVKVGEGAKIGAGAVVILDVPPWTTAVGNRTRNVAGKSKMLGDAPGESMEDTSILADLCHVVI